MFDNIGPWLTFPGQARLGRLLALPTKVRLGWKVWPGTNTLAYFSRSPVTATERFSTVKPALVDLLPVLAVVEEPAEGDRRRVGINLEEEVFNDLGLPFNNKFFGRGEWSSWLTMRVTVQQAKLTSRLKKQREQIIHWFWEKRIIGEKF
jgi:hypothetical protein